MDSIKWKCKNWVVYCRKLDNFHLFHLLVEKLDVFNFHPMFFCCYQLFHTHVRDLNTFFKKLHQRWKHYKEEKQDIERFSVFIIIKISAKSKKN